MPIAQQINLWLLLGSASFVGIKMGILGFVILLTEDFLAGWEKKLLALHIAWAVGSVAITAVLFATTMYIDFGDYYPTHTAITFIFTLTNIMQVVTPLKAK
jgi:hypothetical protein